MTTQQTEMLECTYPNRPYIIAENARKKVAIIFQTRCKRWDCPYCAQRNKALWVARAIHGSDELKEKGLPLSFVTVTSRGRITPQQSLIRFQSAWPKLRKRAQYHGDGVFEYFLVPERQKNGKIHAHMIATTALAQRWWKDNAYTCGLGYMSDAQIVENTAKTGVYVGKYISKAVAETCWPDNFRRVRLSRGWPDLPPPEPLPGWVYDAVRSEGDAYWQFHLLRDMGYEVHFMLEQLAFPAMRLAGL
jgi:hypothetical protein